MIPISSETIEFNNTATATTRKGRVQRFKVNVRCYKPLKRFSHQRDFNDWMTRESKKIPWYLCSTYKVGNVFKRIYACSFRKSVNLKKCNRQLMVLFYPNGSVEVMDSNNDFEQLHCPLNKGIEPSQLRTVIVLRNPDEFSSWMAKQREKFIWHRLAGSRLCPNIDYYQCASVGSNGEMCKRLIHVEYTNQNGVIISELKGLPPHDSNAVHRNAFTRLLYCRPLKLEQGCESNDTLDVLPSTSVIKNADYSETVSFANSSNSTLTSKYGSSCDEHIFEKAATLLPIEDFVIIPDEECESNDGNVSTKEQEIEARSSRSKPSPNSSTTLFSSKTNESNRDLDSDCQSNDNTKTKGDANSQLPTTSEKNSKYNLNNFEEELASKLSKAPPEKVAEIRESLLLEMNKSFARQIVHEIISRSYSSGACKEVLDRIRGVLRQY
uniref:Uncharacterized protein n=1 Tax=Syphacia muris TaxID=451379 RepID=A0A0N5A977_9BILA